MERTAEQRDRPLVTGPPGGAFGEEGDQRGAEGAGPTAGPLDRAVEGRQEVEDGRGPRLDFVVSPAVIPSRLAGGGDSEHRRDVCPIERGDFGARR